MVAIKSVKIGGAFTVSMWTSELADSSLDGLGTNDDKSWGILEWDETTDNDNFVRVDILSSSDVVLKGNLTGSQNSNPRSIDLSNLSEVGETTDIKVRFKLYRKLGRCEVRNIYLNKKVKKMVLTTQFLNELAQWAGSQIAGGGTAVAAAPNRIAYGSGTGTPTEDDTAMGTEVLEEAFSSTPQVSGNEVTFFGNISDGDYGVGDVTEVGVMDNDTDKNLYLRATHTTVTIGAGTVVTYEITVTFSQE